MEYIKIKFLLLSDRSINFPVDFILIDHLPSHWQRKHNVHKMSQLPLYAQIR